MVILDGAIVLVALPSMGADLGFSEQGLQWVLSAYALTFGGLLLLGGRAALLGRRRVFMVGVLSFTLASLVCGLASAGRGKPPTSSWRRSLRPTSGSEEDVMSPGGVSRTDQPQRRHRQAGEIADARDATVAAGVPARAGQPEGLGHTTKEKTMTDHTTGTREEWLAAREQLLAREKEHTRLGDELARQRRELPWVRLEKEYRLDTDDGEKALAELFEGRFQLLVYHFMFGPSYEAGCPVNSSIADAIDGVLPHLRARDASFVLVSQAPLAKLQAYKLRMGWRVPWVSSARSDFNLDLGFSYTEEQARETAAQMGSALPPIVEHNARSTGTDVAGYLTESPGFSTFVHDGGSIFHAYSTTWRGLEFLMSYYPVLDHAPKGRDEADAWQLWIRRHDEYDGR
jgi:predicted dithiol-disulfide oxidoreductase (DUF899 family)